MPTSTTRQIFSYKRPLRLDWYLLSEILGTFLGASIFILFTLLMFQALRLAEFFVLHGTPLFMLLRFTFYMSIALLPVVLPLAFLMALLIGFGRLSTDSEIIALKAGGMSLSRMAVPLGILSLIVCGISIALTTTWVPWGETENKRTENKIANNKAISIVKEGTFTAGFFDLLIFADKVEPKTNRMRRVFIFDERESKNPLTYVAREAEIIPVKTKSELGSAVMLQLYDGSMHHSDLMSHTYEKMDYETYHLYLKFEAAEADAENARPSAIPQDELLRRIASTDPHSRKGIEFRGEYWRRYAIGFSPIIFALLGMGLGTFRYRTQRAGAVLTGFGILLSYYVLQTMGTLAIQRGSLSPFVGMQLPNLVLFVLGIYAFRKASW